MTPKTFEAHGYNWTAHTPGDPCPCDPDSKPIVLLRDGLQSFGNTTAKLWEWGEVYDSTITGWRYAEQPAQEKDELATLREQNASMQLALEVSTLCKPFLL